MISYGKFPKKSSSCPDSEEAKVKRAWCFRGAAGFKQLLQLEAPSALRRLLKMEPVTWADGVLRGFLRDGF